MMAADDHTTDDHTTYTEAVGARLRAIRTQQGLSLLDVEQKSRGRWKAGAAGTYERGDRGITYQVLGELAEYYGVPVGELLPDSAGEPARGREPRAVLDLAALGHAPEGAEPIRRWVASIQAQRGDYNGRVLTIRHRDLGELARVYGLGPQEIAGVLHGWGVLADGGRQAELTTPPPAAPTGGRPRGRGAREAAA